jgi:hypothetical protein
MVKWLILNHSSRLDQAVSIDEMNGLRESPRSEATRKLAAEQLWQQLRDKHWADRCFKDDDDIVSSCCKA